MAALNLAGKTSGYIKLKSPDVALNATVELPNKDGILATLDDIGSGGGSGGGDYTPEALVWEDKLSERALGIKYTNTNNVPLYVQIYTHADAPGKNAQMWIDGIFFGATGNSSGDTKVLNTNLYIIPAGSTYELRPGTATPDLHTWNEARMPLAVASGGSTLESLGIPNHDKVTVAGNGWLSVNGALQSNSDNESHVLFNTGAGESKAQVTYNHPSQQLQFFNGGQQRMKIDADGHTTMQSLAAEASGYVGNFALNTSYDGAFSTLLVQRGSSIGGFVEFKCKGTLVGSIYTNGTTCILDGFTTRASDVYFSDDEDNPRQGKSLKETLADRDKLIDKLVAKVEALEAKLKKVK